MRKPKQARVYREVTRSYFRPEITVCPTCQSRLHRYATLSERTVIRLSGPLKLIHRGYRCPNEECATHRRSYRSAAADALALPGFTFGVDIVILVGHLRLWKHQTLDEVYQGLLERLAPFGLSISRREVLYLFDAYCTLLQAGSLVAEDREWLAQVQANGGLLISIDGIQPEKGNETVYVVRDASDPMYEQDRKLKVEMRKPIQQRVRSVRKQLEKQRQTATGAEQEQLQVLADYTLAIQTAVNLDGKQPFDYAGIAAYDALRAIHTSLQQVEKKGRL